MSLAERRAIERAKWLDTSEQDLATFLGPNAGEFRRVWERSRDKVAAGGAGMAAGWSWAGFVFGFAWFLYRKQWLAGAMLLVAPVVVALLLPSTSGGAFIFVFSAMYGKWAIVQDGVTRISRIRAAGGDIADIAAAGGVSRVAGAIGGTIWLLAVVAAIASILGNRA